MLGIQISTFPQVGVDMKTWENPGYQIIQCWYDYFHGETRDTLINKLSIIYDQNHMTKEEIEDAVAPIRHLPLVFDWEYHFPDVPESYC